jgi:hypothetical protein
MKGTDLLNMQLNGSFNLIEERFDRISDEEWDTRAMPGTSKLGFILWHTTRILDWSLNTVFQGAPEVADQPRWRERFPREACYGAGIPQALADETIASTTRADGREYLREVKAAFMDWFGRQTDQTLEAVPPLKANQEARPGYLDPPVWAEVADLDGLRTWQILARPCVSHIRVHMGEFDVLFNLMRAGARGQAS